MTEAVVSLGGEIDLGNAEALRERLLAAPGQEVVASLAALEFIDASGMSALVEAHQALLEQGRSLVLVDVPSFARKLFDITELASVLDIR